MDNLELYKKAFIDTFMVEESDLPALKYQAIPAWDSVGHMGLMALLEEIFKVELDIDDIIEFSSYETGILILKKYNVVLG